LRRLLSRGAEELEEPSVEPEEGPPEAARACVASTLVSCWRLSSSRMRKERALWKVYGGNLEVMTGLT
jgi:hypothetical protein